MRTWRVALAALAALALAFFIAYQVALRYAREDIASLLGPHAHWSSISVGLGSVVISDFSEDALAGWPGEHELSAKSIVFNTELSSLIKRQPVIIRELRVSDGSAILLRDSGGLQILPVLLRKGEAKPESAHAQGLIIEQLHFQNMRVDFFDRTVARKNFDLVLFPAEGTLTKVSLPSAGKTLGLSVSAPVLAPGGTAHGTFTLAGSIEPEQGSDLDIGLNGVGLPSLAPYYADKSGEIGIVGGDVDLSAHAHVADSKIQAMGVVTMRKLQLASGGNLAQTVMGVPRRMVIDRLENHKGDIVLHFTIAGDAKDPHFSLNETASMRFAAGLSDALGLPVEAVAKGAGTIGEESLNVVGDVVKGIFSH
jgi:hypothetical protein